MFFQTHLAATIFGILIFSDFIGGKFLFAIVAIFSTFLPDMDNGYSYLGRKKIFKPIRNFAKHRTFLHSFTFLIIIFLFLYFWIPVIAYGFLLGYGLHLCLDSMTVRGIKPFWPLKFKIKGKMVSGKGFEIFIFVSLLIIDIFLFLRKILNII
jgi:inner membrane protein